MPEGSKSIDVLCFLVSFGSFSSGGEMYTCTEVVFFIYLFIVVVSFSILKHMGLDVSLEYRF